MSKLTIDGLYMLSKHWRGFVKFILETKKHSGVNDFILKTKISAYKLNVEIQGKKMKKLVVVAARDDEEEKL